MVFASPTFLFLFLPLFLAGYYLLPGGRRSGWILVGSWVFYGWWRLDFLLLLVTASLGAGWIGRRIARSSDAAARRRWTVTGVTAALAVLGYFKYFNFGVNTASRVVASLGGSTAWATRLWEVVLPVGISFFVFQIISYMVDVHRGTAPEARSITDVAAYVSLFPQLVAGPIVRYSEIADQLRERRHSWSGFAAGARRFSLGIVRKVLIADAVAPLVHAVFASSDPGFAAAWLGVAAYTVQIYYDFSAYSDMAIGLGGMMGFRFPENFLRPYHSASITEFWRRWHVTLSSWLRDYLYIPLGGSRRGSRRTIVNLMTVMVLGGLWHGAAWTFVFWGAWHGLWLVLERVFPVGGGEPPVRIPANAPAGARTPTDEPAHAPGRTPSHAEAHAPGRTPSHAEAHAHLRRGAGRLRRGAGRLYTLGVVMVGWVFFRAESFGDAGRILTGMVGRNGWAIGPEILWRIQPGAVAALLVGVLVAAAEPRIFRDGQARPLLLTVLFAWAVARLLAASYSPFLYFQF